MSSEMKEEWKVLDLATMRYEEWLAFFFDRPIHSDQSMAESFYSTYDEVTVSQPRQIVNYIARMCNGFTAIVSKYTLAQVDQGLWAAFATLSVQRHLFDPSVQLGERELCVRSMYRVYSDGVAKLVADVRRTFFWMWWDCVASQLWVAAKVRIGDYDVNLLDQDQRAIMAAILETLASILRIDHLGCQLCALHGLGHLHHPSVPSIVQAYLDRHRDMLQPEELAWIERCRDGTAE